MEKFASEAAFERLSASTAAVQRAAQADEAAQARLLNVAEPECRWIEDSLLNLRKRFGTSLSRAREHILTGTVPALCTLFDALAGGAAMLGSRALASGSCMGSSIAAAAGALDTLVRLREPLNAVLNRNNGVILQHVAIVMRVFVSSPGAQSCPRAVEKLLRLFKSLLSSVQAQELALSAGGAAHVFFEAIIINGASADHWLSTKLVCGDTVLIHELGTSILLTLAGNAGTDTFRRWWQAAHRAENIVQCYLSPSVDYNEGACSVDVGEDATWDDCGIYASNGGAAIQVRQN